MYMISIETKDSKEQSEKLYEINETIYDTDLNYTDITKPFLAYGQSGSVSSDELYYANYCEIDDFELLVKNGLNMTDKIVLCKYGYSFRGSKVQTNKSNKFDIEKSKAKNYNKNR